MTRIEVAAVLRELAEGDGSVYGEALRFAVRVLEPAPRKAKRSANMEAFLKLNFVSYADQLGAAYGRALPEREYSREALSQFRYGRRGSQVGGSTPQLDKAILAAARVSERVAA